MTTYLGKSCSFCLPRVPFVNCCQFMYLVISLLVLRAGYGICLYQFLIIACLFTSIYDHEFIVHEFSLPPACVQHFMNFIWFLPLCKIFCNVKAMLPGQT